MPYAVGIDLGTTFTSAAVGDATGTRMVPLSPEIVVPSLAYHAPDGTLLTGAAAASAAVDPARLGRGFKRRLGDPTPLMLGGAAYSPSALMAAQLRAVLDQVTAAMGEPPASVMLSCPAIWGPYRREQFAEVPRLADVGDVTMITEPEAAATHYSRERALGEGEVVAVYDLGGGTLDTTVLRIRSDGMEILGTPEGIEHLGGMDFDDALLAHLDERLDGAITRLDPADPAAAAALADIRALCVRAKIDLSTEPDVTLNVPLPTGAREVTITRLEFNAVIRPSVELTVAALRRTVASAGLQDDDLSAVLLAGGSSRVPLVTQLVFEAFDKPVRVAHHPKFTVALGAATVAARALAAPPVAPVVELPAPRTPRKRRWLVPTSAAVVAVVAALVVSLVLAGADDGHAVNPAANRSDATTTTEAPTTTTTTPPATTTTTAQPTTAAPGTGSAEASVGVPLPDPLVIYGDAAVGPYRTFIASPEKWDGTEVVGPSAAHATISANTADGLRVTWTGGAPGQVYLQTVHADRNLSSYVDSGGALVFDVLLHEKPAGMTSVAAHCHYPCGAQVDASKVFNALPVGEQTKVTIPLSCLTAKNLNKTIVDTPFLVYAEGPLDVTFRNIAWVPGAASDPGATPCSDLP